MIKSNDTARYPFVVATILDPSVRVRDRLPRKYTCCRIQIHSSTTLTPGMESSRKKVETRTTNLHRNTRSTTDVHSATLNFIARSVDTTQAMVTAEFDRHSGDI